MRKLFPTFILTSIVALSSGTAFALGDMNKTKKTTAANTASTQTAPRASDETTKPCKGLTPSDAAWKANNCSADGGSTTPNAQGKRADSLGGAGASGPGK